MSTTGTMQEVIAVQTEQLGRGLYLLQELRAHLALPKFQGEANNWISATDLQAWVQRIQEALTADAECNPAGVQGCVLRFRAPLQRCQGNRRGLQAARGLPPLQDRGAGRFCGSVTLTVEPGEVVIPRSTGWNGSSEAAATGPNWPADFIPPHPTPTAVAFTRGNQTHHQLGISTPSPFVLAKVLGILVIQTNHDGRYRGGVGLGIGRAMEV